MNRTTNAPRLLPLLALTSLAPVAWGTTYWVTTELLPADRPLLAATLRALPAGILLLLLGRATGRGSTPVVPRGDWWWRAAVLGALNIAVFLALLFVSAYRLPGGVAATLGAVQPLVLAGLAFAVLGERPRTRSVVAGVLGVVGVGLLVLRASAQLDAVGVVAGVVGTSAAALGIVLMRRWGRPTDLVTFTAWQLTAGGLLLAPLALGVEGLPDAVVGRHVTGWTYLALVGTAGAYLLWFRGMDHLPPTDVSLLALLSPVVAAAIGWAVLDQALTEWQLLGAGIALGGLALGQTGGRRPLPVDVPCTADDAPVPRSPEPSGARMAV
nr:EamA family transporter [uncultured Actinotalea sp.]